MWVFADDTALTLNQTRSSDESTARRVLLIALADGRNTALLGVGSVRALVVLNIARAAEGSTNVDEVRAVNDKALATLLDCGRGTTECTGELLEVSTSSDGGGSSDVSGWGGSSSGSSAGSGNGDSDGFRAGFQHQLN